MRPIKPSDPRVPQIADLCCKAKRGLPVGAAIKRLGYSRALTQALLAHCRKQGLLVLYKISGAEWRWMSPADHLEILSDAETARVTKRREAGQRLYRFRREVGMIDTYNRVIDPPDWPIERRIVKADGSPLPFVCRAPNSVFALGGA